MFRLALTDHLLRHLFPHPDLKRKWGTERKCGGEWTGSAEERRKYLLLLTSPPIPFLI